MKLTRNPQHFKQSLNLSILALKKDDDYEPQMSDLEALRQPTQEKQPEDLSYEAGITFIRTGHSKMCVQSII